MLIDFVDGRGSLRQENPVGLLLGTTWDPVPSLRLEAQFRAVTETGFLFSAGYLF